MNPTNIYSSDNVHIDEPLFHVVDLKGSELHLAADSHPMMLLGGSLKTMDFYEKLSESTLERMITDILTNEQVEQLDNGAKLDFDYTTADATTRFNCKAFRGYAGIVAIFSLLH